MGLVNDKKGYIHLPELGSEPFIFKPFHSNHHDLQLSCPGRFKRLPVIPGTHPGVQFRRRDLL